MNIHHSSERAWWAVGLALGAALIIAAHKYIGVLVLSLFIYYASRPLRNRVQRVIPSDSVAAIITLALFVLPTLAIIGYTANIALNELYNIAIRFDAANIKPIIEPYVATELTQLNWNQLINTPTDFFTSDSGVSFARKLFGYTLSSLGLVGSTLINLALIFILSFYFLRDDETIATWIQTHLGAYLPQWDVFAREVDEDLSNIFFGNILHALITAIIAVTTFNLLSILNPSPVPIPYPTLLGLLAGIASLIPMVGTKLVYAPVGIYMILWSGSFNGFKETISVPIGFIAVSYLIIDTIPDVVIRPYISSKRIHMGLVMLTYIVGPAMFGWYGLFIGPILLVLGLHFTTHILPLLLEPEPPLDDLERVETPNNPKEN